MDREELLYKLTLGLTPGLTAVAATALIQKGLGLQHYLDYGISDLGDVYDRDVTGVTDKVARQEAFFKACKEMEFILRHKIKVHFVADESYPFMLREIADAPVALFQLGETDLNSSHMISVVGTRRVTPYGSSFCSRFIEETAGYFPDAVVISGLAYGVDCTAHQSAMQSGLITMGVVAHGLDTIYPAPHRDLARRIIKEGGSILSEYPSGTTPFQKRFLERNRIVAGLSELTVVIESPLRGGAMSTANSAFNYSREVMALPGRVGDEMSEGCNHLIRKEKAHLLTSASDVVELMGWKPAGIKVSPRQRRLFPELEGNCAIIYNTLRDQREPLSIDTLHALTRVRVPELMSTLTEMEFDGIIIRHPGNRYSVS